jgi:hypothetical protein
MRGAAPVTVTDSCSVATFIVKLIVTDSPTPRRNPSRTTLAKPLSSAVILYVPSGIAGIRYAPLSAVTVVREVPVST